MPLAGLITPAQANGLIKPTQKGQALFENQSPGFTAEFGDRKDPAQHKIRFEAAPNYNDYKSYNGYKDYSAEKPSAFQRAKESLLGATPKGVELRLVELAAEVPPSGGTDYNLYNNYKSYNASPASEKLEKIQSQLQDVQSGLEKLETGITAVSKDVAEVTKVTKNILEESGVGKPELGVRPSMEETPEDFAKTAGNNDYNGYNNYNERSVPPATLTAPIDTISQTIDETTKMEYQIVVGKGVKESITLLDKNYNDYKGYNTYTFELKLDPGVEVRQSIDGLADKSYNGYNDYKNYGVIYFVDQFGRYLFHFQTPYMIDAGGAKSSAVELQLDDYKSYNGYNSYKLRVTADEQWLAAPERVYPVLIDPTIVHEDNPAFASGTENRSQINSANAVETKFKELQTDINTVGLWHFNEGSSTTAYDSSGNSNNGTLTNGPVWNGPLDTQVGLGKSSLKFDGNAYINVPDSSNWDFGTRDFTIEFWYKDNGSGDSKCQVPNF